MPNIFDGIEDILPEVFFDELFGENSKNKPYKFRFLNWQDAKIIKEGIGNYAIIECLALGDYPELSLYSGQLFNLYLAQKSFNRGIRKFVCYYHHTEILKILKIKNKILVIDIELTRKNNMSTTITWLRIMEIKGKNDELLIIECPKEVKNEEEI